jgi:AcrR family transcriptional regulator
MEEETQKLPVISDPSRGSYHHGDLHNSLLEAADCLLEQTGAAKLSLREVAKHAGVSHTAPYRHFKNRAALLEAIAIAGFRRLKTLLEQAEASAPDDIVQQLRAGGLAYLQVAVNNPEHTRLMFGGMMKEVSEDSALFAAAEDTYDTLYRIIDTGRARGVFGGSDTETVVLAAWSLVHGLTMLILGTQKVNPATPTELDAITRSVLDTFLNGLRA